MTEPWRVEGLSGLRDWELVSNLPTSQVWRAVEHNPRRHVALKIVSIHGPDDAERFRRECASLTTLSTKKGIVTLYDFRLVDADRVGWLKLEFCSGGSLQDHLDRFGPLAVASARSYLADVAEALTAVHARNRLHCDIKPANILIDEHGDAKLADFGIARTVRPPSDDNDPEATDQVAGFSPGFIPPESSLIDATDTDRSYRPPEAGLALETERTSKYDVWLLGATFVALTTGSPPPRGESATATRARLKAVGVDEVLTEAVLYALAPAPADRPTMTELQSAFAAQPNQGLHQAAGTGAARRSRLLGWTLASGAGLAMAGLVAFVAVRDDRPAGIPGTSVIPAAATTSVAPVPATSSDTAPTSTPSSLASPADADVRILDPGPSAGQDPDADGDELGAVVVYSRFGDLSTQLGRCSGDCSDFASSPLDMLGTTAHYPRVALGGGLPTVVAVDSASGQVAIISCLTRDCSTSERRDIPISPAGQEATKSLSPRPSPEEQLITLHVDVAMTPDNRPVVVFDDPATKDITLLLCDDPPCRTWTTRTIGVGVWPKVEVGADGLPMVVYSADSLAGPLSLFRCSDAECTTSTQRSFSVIGMRPTIATAGENVFIAALDFTQPALTLIACAGLNCDDAAISAAAVDSSYPTLQAVASAKGVHLAYFQESAGNGVVQSCNWPCTAFVRNDIRGERFALADSSGDFVITDFGHDAAPVISDDGRLMVFSFVLPPTGQSRALGIVVSRSASCGDAAFCAPA